MPEIPRRRPTTVDEIIAEAEHHLVYQRALWRGFWIGIGLAGVTVLALHAAGVL